MKIFRSLFLVALMAITFTAAADNVPVEELRLTSKVVEGKTIMIRLVNLQQVSTSVKILTLDGKTTYFTETIRKHNGYARKINLDKLPEGRYVIQVKQEDSVKNQVIVVRGNTLQLSSIRG